jgi:hypothetical protein
MTKSGVACDGECFARLAGLGGSAGYELMFCGEQSEALGQMYGTAREWNTGPGAALFAAAGTGEDF